MSQVHLNQCTDCPYCQYPIPRWKLDDHITDHLLKNKKKSVRRQNPDVIVIPDERPLPEHDSPRVS